MIRRTETSDLYEESHSDASVRS